MQICLLLWRRRESIKKCLCMSATFIRKFPKVPNKMPGKIDGGALSFEIIAKCPVTRARVSVLKLPHGVVETPVFMPVGTQGTMKGLLPEQVKGLGCQILLGNTYHLGHRPGAELVQRAGGLHKFMNWDGALLTDSGGFQMVSLAQLMEVTEEGVRFCSPHTGEEMLLTPEKSVEIQNMLGADIIMQLDDVVHSTTTGPRVEEAVHRTVRWLDRCLSAHRRPTEQNLFGIVQGGLDRELRSVCVEKMLKLDLPGFAIGGLSGGEEKDLFWRVVHQCTELLPPEKPRYLMGVGWAVDLVVCCALGVDMFDCVFPTRVARFGTALTPYGMLNLTKSECAEDFRPIQSDCSCSTCRTYSRAALHCLNKEAVSCHLVSIHNLTYQMRLMADIRQSIVDKTFPQFVRRFLKLQFTERSVPVWAFNALKSVNINI